MKRRTLSTWGVPAALAAVTLIGLLSALVADGWADTLSWLALGRPVGVCFWYGCARR